MFAAVFSYIAITCYFTATQFFSLQASVCVATVANDYIVISLATHALHELSFRRNYKNINFISNH